MSSGGARRGRRDNGLDAAEYAVAGDVDPRVGEHLLDVLAVQGIAAYLQPAVDLNPVTRNTVMPSRPTDRLFVDRAHLRTARDYVAQLAEPRGAALPAGTAGGDGEGTAMHPGAGGRNQELEDAWAEIVARYDTEVDAATASWPESENVAADRDSTDPDDRAAPDDRTAPDRTAPDDEPDDGAEADGAETEAHDQGRDPRRARAATRDEPPSLLTALDTFGAHLPDDPSEDEGYSPPPPPPLPRPSKYTVGAILAVVGGFVLFLKPSLLPIDPDVGMMLGFIAVMAGFGTLVWRLRPGGDDEDDYDPDDGARV